MQLSLAACLFAALVGTVHGAANEAPQNPITRIVNMLKKMVEGVEKDMDKDEKLYNKFACWAKTSMEQKETENAAADERVKELTSYIDDLDNGRIELTSERADLEKQLAETTAKIEEAESNRNTEKSDFDAAKEEMTAAIAALTDAVDVLGTATKDTLKLLRVDSSAGFAAFNQESSQLSLAVEYAKQVLGKGDLEFLRRVLTGDAGPDMKKLNRKANFKMDYKARSGNIQKLLADLLKDFKTQLATAEDKESKAVEDYDALMESLTDMKQSQSKALNSGSSEKGAKAKAKGDAQDEIDALTAQTDANKKFIKETTSLFDDQKENYRARVTAMNQEIKELQKAIEILYNDDARDLAAKSFKSQGYLFVQVRQRAREARFEARLALNRAAIAKAESMGAVVKRDDFNTSFVTNQLDKVLADLDQKREDLLTQKEQCERDIDQFHDDIHAAEQFIEKRQEVIEGLIKEIQERNATIDQCNADIKDSQTKKAELIQQRDEEHAEFQKQKRDDELMIDTLARAVKVLSDVYTSLLQSKRVPNSRRDAEDIRFEEYTPGEKGQESDNVLTMIKTAKEDLEKDVKTSTAADKKATEKLEKMSKALDDDVADLQDEIVKMEGQRGDLQIDEADEEEQKAQKEKEKSDLEESLQKTLDAGCFYIIHNYDKIDDALVAKHEEMRDAKTAIKAGLNAV